MLARSPNPSRFAALFVALRFAWRELRGGLQGFGVFIACIALGVMAIAGVGSVAASLDDGIAGAGRVLLGGDLAFWLIERQASGAERAFLDAHGRVSVATDLRAMARTADGRSTLVELKAVIHSTAPLRPTRRCRFPHCSRKPAVCSAQRPIRRYWRGSI
jgi:putative ABC transport system permease protein